MPDRETDTMVVIAGLLSDLDRNACERIVRWAEGRFVKGSGPAELADAAETAKWFVEFADIVGQVAGKYQMTPLDVVAALENAVKVARVDEPVADAS